MLDVMGWVSDALTLADERGTDDLGRALAPLLVPGDALLLRGPLGAGKSHLARRIIRERLGVTGDIPSPTFTLVQTYEARGVEIWHADLYRLGHPDEIAELGLEDAFDAAICLVEWPDRLGPLAPATALTVDLSIEGTGRSAVFATDAGAWRDRLCDVL